MQQSPGLPLNRIDHSRVAMSRCADGNSCGEIEKQIPVYVLDDRPFAAFYR
jgi:hypothetical protein